MKLIIDIPEILFEKIQNRKADKRTLETVIMRGIPQEPTTDGYMLVCPNCGLDVHSDFESCPRCGENLKARKHEERLQRERY